MSFRRILQICGLIGAVAFSALWARQAFAADPPKLQYGFQNGREYVYNVKVVADLPDQEQTHEGIYTCKITDATESQFTLQVSGGLAEKIKPKPGLGRRRGYPFPLHFAPRIPGFGDLSRPAGTTIGRQGNLITEGRLNLVPLLLGYAEMLFIEPLPGEAKALWSAQSGQGAAEPTSPSWHHVGRFTEGDVANGASEQIDFGILETKADTVRISKKYRLHFVVEFNGKLKIDMTGNGEFEFDRKEGLIKSETMKYEFGLAKENVNVTIPIAFDFRLFSAEEAATYKKKMEVDHAAALEAAHLKPMAGIGPGGQGLAFKELTSTERAQILKELNSGNPRRIMAAAMRLCMSARDDKPEPISQALCRALKSGNPMTKPVAMRALSTWAAPSAEKTVLAAAKESNPSISGPAIIALRHFKSAAAAEVAAGALANQATRHDAAATLKAMGPVAEPYVIPYVDNNDLFVRQDAREILSAIGGKKSLKVLQAQLAKADFSEKNQLQTAVAAIEARAQSEPEGTTDPGLAAGKAEAAPPVAAETDAAGPKPRTWSDATGAYQVEATFVRFADGKVTLKRTSGKEVTLPLSKLSAKDREYVEKQSKRANPFE